MSLLQDEPANWTDLLQWEILYLNILQAESAEEL